MFTLDLTPHASQVLAEYEARPEPDNRMSSAEYTTLRSYCAFLTLIVEDNPIIQPYCAELAELFDMMQSHPAMMLKCNPQRLMGILQEWDAFIRTQLGQREC